MKNGTNAAKIFVKSAAAQASRRINVDREDFRAFVAKIEAAEHHRTVQEILLKLGAAVKASNPVVRPEGVDEDFAIAGAQRENAARARTDRRAAAFLSPSARTRQKLQGRYLGLGRTATKAVRAKAKAIYAKQGAVAAVKYLEKAAQR